MSHPDGIGLKFHFLNDAESQRIIRTCVALRKHQLPRPNDLEWLIHYLEGIVR